MTVCVSHNQHRPPTAPSSSDTTAPRAQGLDTSTEGQRGQPSPFLPLTPAFAQLCLQVCTRHSPLHSLHAHTQEGKQETRHHRHRACTGVTPARATMPTTATKLVEHRQPNTSTANRPVLLERQQYLRAGKLTRAFPLIRTEDHPDWVSKISQQFRNHSYLISVQTRRHSSRKGGCYPPLAHIMGAKACRGPVSQV